MSTIPTLAILSSPAFYCAGPDFYLLVGILAALSGFWQAAQMYEEEYHQMRVRRVNMALVDWRKER